MISIEIIQSIIKHKKSGNGRKRDKSEINATEPPKQISVEDQSTEEQIDFQVGDKVILDPDKVGYEQRVKIYAKFKFPFTIMGISPNNNTVSFKWSKNLLEMQDNKGENVHFSGKESKISEKPVMRRPSKISDYGFMPHRE